MYSNINIINTTMKKITFLALAAISLLLSSCTNEGEVVKDIDGNVYTVVRIGYQEWMVENLKVTHYNDGTPIEYAVSNEEWVAADSLKNGAWCVYDFKGNAEEALTANAFVSEGALYNFYAVQTGKLAPKGWRVATVDDWLLLQAYCTYNRWNYDNSHSVNKIAKALADNQYWMDSTDDDIDNIGDLGTKGYYVEKNNISGFSALPAGDRRPIGDYAFRGEQTFWWTSSLLENVDDYAYIRYLSNNENGLLELPCKLGFGFSVRCVRDVRD